METDLGSRQFAKTVFKRADFARGFSAIRLQNVFFLLARSLQ
jgi:hypothetical protein